MIPVHHLVAAGRDYVQGKPIGESQCLLIASHRNGAKAGRQKSPPLTSKQTLLPHSTLWRSGLNLLDCLLARELQLLVNGV